MPSGTVLVTGASTGIGHVTALHLAELGFDAVGAVRKDEDAERLRAEGLRAVQLDVTDAGTIAAAREALGDGPLAGLVNNARSAGAPIETESGLEPRVVAEVIGQALTSSRPRARYLVGRDAKLRAPMATILPARVMDRLIGRAIG